MAGPTDVLTEDVKDLREANRQLAAEIKGVFERLSADMRDSSNRLADEVHSLGAEMRESNVRLAETVGGLARDFGNFRVEVAKELGALRAEAAKDLGEINTKLEAAATSLRLVGRAVAILIPVVFSLIGGAFWLTWQAAKLDSRVAQVEKAVSAAEKPGAARL